jgi:hypothetical protein
MIAKVMIAKIAKLLVVCVLLLPSFGRAKAYCPWLNEATAAGVVNGPVTMEVKSAGGRGGSCIFRLTADPSAYGLWIVVEKVDTTSGMMTHGAQCASAAVPLKGIGNEAAMCEVKMGSSYVEQVVGRVRDQMFVVTLGVPMSPDPSANEEMLKQRVARVSEQVAGSLF